MIPPVPPAIVEKVGQGTTPELARLRAIREVMMPFGVSVDSVYSESSTNRGSQSRESILVQVNVNSVPGIEITREYRQHNTYYAVVRFDLARAQEQAVVQVNKDLGELMWLFDRPRSASRKHGLHQTWILLQRDLSTCTALGVQRPQVPQHRFEEESRGPKLVIAYDKGGDKDPNQFDLVAAICRTYGDPDGTHIVKVQARYAVNTLPRTGDRLLHRIKILIILNGVSHLISEEVTTPRLERPTLEQILGVASPHLEELISSL